jgi:hypothetical protein
LTAGRPTLVSLGFDWKIDGDDNRNATVEVACRKKGETAWREALPLLAGVFVYQNTFVGEVIARGPASNVHFRNNLVVAQNGNDPVFAVGTYTRYSPSDYLDADPFVHVTMPDRSDPQRLYTPGGLDFQPRPTAPVVDAGTPPPSITDGFTGRAPDIGAYEIGRPLPHYRPRTGP